MGWFTETFNPQGNVNPGKTSADIEQTARDDRNRGESREMGTNTTPTERQTYWDTNPTDNPW